MLNNKVTEQLTRYQTESRTELNNIFNRVSRCRLFEITHSEGQKQAFNELFVTTIQKDLHAFYNALTSLICGEVDEYVKMVGKDGGWDIFQHGQDDDIELNEKLFNRNYQSRDVEFPPKEG